MCSRGNPALMLLLYADDNSCSFFGKHEFAAIQFGSLQSDLAAKLVSVPNCANLLHSIVIPTSTEQLNYAVFHKIDWSSVRGAAELDARVVKVQAVVRGRRARQTARNRTTANRKKLAHYVLLRFVRVSWNQAPLSTWNQAPLSSQHLRFCWKRAIPGQHRASKQLVLLSKRRVRFEGHCSCGPLLHWPRW